MANLALVLFLLVCLGVLYLRGLSDSAELARYKGGILLQKQTDQASEKYDRPREEAYQQQNGKQLQLQIDSELQHKLDQGQEEEQ
ncbi:MAG: hypothetical protein SGCHY_005516, partial [Lobulomycetales sp.]